jgi:hypothetical protein
MGNYIGLGGGGLTVSKDMLSAGEIATVGREATTLPSGPFSPRGFMNTLRSEGLLPQPSVAPALVADRKLERTLTA